MLYSIKIKEVALIFAGNSLSEKSEAALCPFKLSRVKSTLGKVFEIFQFSWISISEKMRPNEVILETEFFSCLMKQ